MFMKDFKRVISMILVVAMLAGFAGIPGMPSIVAQAADKLDYTRTTTGTAKDLDFYATADGYSLDGGKRVNNGQNGKPTGSFAATNTATLDVPPILYSNGSTIVKDLDSTYKGLDTTLSVTVPDEVMDDINGNGSDDMYVRLNIISVDFSQATNDDTIKLVYGVKDLDPYFDGLNDSSNNMIYEPVSKNGSTYYTGTHKDNGDTYTVDFDLSGVSANLSESGYMLFRIDYIVMHDAFNADAGYDDGDGKIPVSELGMEKIQVMYSQYAASVVSDLDFRAMYKMNNAYGAYYKGKESHSASFLYFDQYINFFDVLTKNGVAVETSFRNTSDSINVNGSYGAPFSSVSESQYGLSAAINQAYGTSVQYGAWTPNGSNMQADNNYDSAGLLGNAFPTFSASIGAKVYYDKDASLGTTLDFSIHTDYKSKSITDTGAKTVYINAIQFLNEIFSVNGNGPSREINAGATTWNASGYSGTNTFNVKNSGTKKGHNFQWVSGDSNSIDAISTNYNDTGNWVQNTGNQKTTYRVKLNDTRTLYNVANVFVTDKSGNDYGTKTHGNSVTGVATNYHIDLIPVDRSNSRNYISYVLSANYIKDEMDETWWTSYRNSVLNAYRNLGMLNSTAEPISLDSNNGDSQKIYSPIYKGANYELLVTALQKNPYYEQGSSGYTLNIPEGAGYSKLSDDLKNKYTPSKYNADGTLKEAAVYISGVYTEKTYDNFVAARNKAVAFSQACLRSYREYGYLLSSHRPRTISTMQPITIR